MFRLVFWWFFRFDPGMILGIFLFILKKCKFTCIIKTFIVYLRII